MAPYSGTTASSEVDVNVPTSRSDVEIGRHSLPLDERVKGISERSGYVKIRSASILRGTIEDRSCSSTKA